MRKTFTIQFTRYVSDAAAAISYNIRTNNATNIKIELHKKN